MDNVTISTRAFRNGLSDSAMRRLLDCLYGLNLDYLRRFPDTPKIYECGVRYKEEPITEERWNDLPTLIAKKQGDCEDLACARAAELTVSGQPSFPFFRSRIINTGAIDVQLFHILVRRSDGLIEDPSTVLGMNPPFNPQSPFAWRE